MRTLFQHSAQARVIKSKGIASYMAWVRFKTLFVIWPCEVGTETIHMGDNTRQSVVFWQTDRTTENRQLTV